MSTTHNLRYFCIFFILLLCLPSFGQLETKYAAPNDVTIPKWAQLMYADNANPDEVIKGYEEFYKTEEFVKNKHTQYYKRWLRSLSRELPPRTEDKEYLKKSAQLRTQRSSSTWTSIGPIDWDHTAAAVSYAPGSAHVYTVEQAPSNGDILYAGTANAGIYKSIDHGLNWLPLTDDLLLNTSTAIEVSPTNANIVYAEMFNSVYKSIDGGITWNPTGNTSFQSTSMNVKDIQIRSTNANTLFLASSTGLYRSIDAGLNWTLVLSGDFLEIEFHPTNANVVYATRVVGDATEFWKSTNGGSNFTQQTLGWPVPAAGDEQKRTEIAVSPADPTKVVALCTGAANGGSGLYGIYVSTDEGVNWTFQCCGPQPAGVPSSSNMNLMGWSDVGTDDGGQYYYDLALDISPTDADHIFVGGVNLWVSTDGGSSFTCPAKWSHSYKPNYVHADIHEIHYNTNGELWVAGDGGMFVSSDGGDNFARSNVGISGTDFWGFGMGFWYGDVMLGGAYHNGTLLKEENVYDNGWLCTDGGDGNSGYVNYGDDRQVYSQYNIKKLLGDRTLSPITRTFDYKPNSSYIVGQSSDLIVHPHYYETWFSGSGTQLVKTEDNGYSFTVIHDFGVAVASMDISWTNPDVMYVATFPGWWDTKQIYRTTDGGLTWTDITPTSAETNGNTWIPYDIVVSEQDPMKVFIARTSMYGSSNINGYMVYSSTDGGDNWTNISGSGMNGQTPSCIQLQKGTDDGLYVGTRRTVYYKSNSESDWQLYNSGLPISTAATKIEMYYRKAMVRNASNRSVYEIDFYEPSSPVAMPSVHKRETTCVGDTFYFVDHSILSEDNVSWLWTFDGATPSSSTERAPKVVYNDPGIYDVTLTVSDAYGTDTRTMEDFIQINKSCKVDIIPGQAVNCNGTNGHILVDDVNLLAEETMTMMAWVKLNGVQPEYAGIIMNDGDAAGINFRENNNTLAYHWPGGSWSWDSNLEVPIGEWAHVALVANETSITLYLNGTGVTHNTNINPIDFSSIRLGSYKNWGSRNMNGLIDEVAIYDRALSQSEIRELRHLTKIPNNDPSLIAYYQMNEDGSDVLDKVGNRDGVLNGSAIKVGSTAPVGGGLSQRLTVSNTGPIEFDIVGLTLGFATGGTHPNGELVVSHLHVAPDEYPNSSPVLDEGYWIVNNYGTNQTFSTLDSMTFYKTGTITTAMTDGSGYTVYQRGDNDDTNVWNEKRFLNIVPTIKDEGVLSGISSTNITDLGQYVITRAIFPKGTPQVSILADPNSLNFPYSGKSMELYMESNNQGLGLPVYNHTTMTQTYQAQAGHFAYHENLKTVIYYDGSQWIEIETEAILSVENPGLVTPTVYLSNDPSAPSSSPSALLSLSSSGAFVKLPSYSAQDIVNIEYPEKGMLVYKSDDQQLSFFNGHQWKSFTGELSTIITGSLNNSAEEGMMIGAGTKDDASILEIGSTDKTISIPVVDIKQVKDPIIGLLVFDDNYESLLVFDGNNWRILK